MREYVILNIYKNQSFQPQTKNDQHIEHTALKEWTAATYRGGLIEVRVTYNYVVRGLW